MAVPMNMSSYREVGDPPVEIDKATKRRANETPYQNKRKMQEADQKTTYDETITIPNAREALGDARSRPRDNIRRDDYDT